MIIVLRRLSQAFGGVTKVANTAGLNTTTLCQTLSTKGNPELKSITVLLRALGVQLAVRPLPRECAA